MPITFEEVTGEIQREPQAPGAGAAAAPAPAPASVEDLASQLDRELRLRAERASRLSAD